MNKINNKTVKTVSTALTLLLISILLFSCGEDSVVPPIKPDPKPDDPKPLQDWFSWDPTSPDADKELTIFFKAPSTSELYNYKGDVYVHIGIINEGA